MFMVPRPLSPPSLLTQLRIHGPMLSSLPHPSLQNSHLAKPQPWFNSALYPPSTPASTGRLRLKKDPQWAAQSHFELMSPSLPQRDLQAAQQSYYSLKGTYTLSPSRLPHTSSSVSLSADNLFLV